MKAVAKQVERPTAEVDYWIQRGGADRADRRRRYDYERVAALWNSDTPTRVMASELGTTERGVHLLVERIRKRGWSLKGRLRGRRPGSKWEAVAPVVESMWADGLTTVEMARELGVAPDSMHSAVGCLRARGYHLPPRRASGKGVANRDREIAAMWREGRSVREIARAVGRSQNAVRSRAAVLRRQGVDLPRRQTTKHDWGRVAEMWNSGAPAKAIAAEQGTSEKTILILVSRLRREGRDLAYRRRPGGRIDRERLVELWKAGMPTGEIAEEFGVTVSTVANCVSRLRRQGWDVEYRTTRINDSRLVELWGAGVRTSEIAEDLGATVGAVSGRVAFLRRRGERLARRRGLDRVIETRLFELWEAGVPTADIAEELGVTPVAIRGRVLRMRRRGENLRPRRPGRRPTRRDGDGGSSSARRRPPA